MDIITLNYPLPNVPPALQGKPLSLAVGHFDGVHRGHQNVIRKAVEAARRNGMLAGVMTFHPHPKEVLGQGDHYYSALTPLRDKTALFKELGVDVVLVVQFDLNFAAVKPEQFIDEVLRPLQAKHVVVGFDFTFGYRGLGTPELLTKEGRPEIEVEIVEQLCERGVKVSSTLVRAALEEGRVDEAALLLGRPYSVTGVVAHGDKRGRTIGYPTANVEIQERYVLPRLGVYAITAEWNGKSFYGVMNLGKKPTF
ncbi:riboflavin biosynthesis protein RibF, partial [Paenibacillus thailandensis]